MASKATSALGAILRPNLYSAPQKYGTNVANYIAFATPERVTNYRRVAGGRVGGLHSSRSSSGVEYCGPVGGIFRPSDAGLWPGTIVYRIAGKYGATDEEIARNVCAGSWWLTPDVVDDMRSCAHSITQDERRELFNVVSDDGMLVKLWEARMAIGTVPAEPWIVKCKVTAPAGTFMGRGNATTPDYSRDPNSFPIFPGHFSYSQIFIPGFQDENGARIAAGSADALDASKFLEILDARPLDKG